MKTKKEEKCQYEDVECKYPGTCEVCARDYKSQEPRKIMIAFLKLIKKEFNNYGLRRRKNFCEFCQQNYFMSCICEFWDLLKVDNRVAKGKKI